jgi:hypothetical protein
MCSSAIREVGGLTSAAQEIGNESKSNKDAGQRTPADVAISDPETSTTERDPGGAITTLTCNNMQLGS